MTSTPDPSPAPEPSTGRGIDGPRAESGTRPDSTGAGTGPDTEAGTGPPGASSAGTGADGAEPGAGAAALVGLATAPFVLLTTYRRTGEPVATPVWAAPDPAVAGRLWVTTPAGSGKVKRLGRTSRVTLAPCDRRGRTAPGAVEVDAAGTVVDDEATARLVHAALVTKHGAAVRVVDAITALGRARAGLLRRTPPRRVSVRLDPPG